jgi:cytochrome o ubiquinol oxidase subunit 3
MEHHNNDKTVFGFWVYLMTDLLMFAVLFACYATLHENSFGGPGPSEIFSLPLPFAETMILLLSSFTCGIGVYFARAKDATKTLFLFITTFILGASFLTIEFSEFSHLIADGNVPQRSAFLSSFFTLVGTHGLHISAGLFWMGILLIQILRKGLTDGLVRKLTLLSLFWHFLDIVWIFIFTLVYLMGVL